MRPEAAPRRIKKGKAYYRHEPSNKWQWEKPDASVHHLALEKEWADLERVGARWKEQRAIDGATIWIEASSGGIATAIPDELKIAKQRLQIIEHEREGGSLPSPQPPKSVKSMRDTSLREL